MYLLPSLLEIDTMDKLIGFIITPPAEGDSELRIYRYSYYLYLLQCY